MDTGSAGRLDGETYRGVPVPENVRRAAGTGFADDAYIVGWKDGADAVLSRLGEQVSREADRDLDAGGDSYRGVPLPGAWTLRDRTFRDTWQDGVDNAWASWSTDKTAGQDTGDVPDVTRDGTEGMSFTPSEDVNAFALVTEERTAEARGIVSRMSGRDRAVLSFWLEELRDIVSGLESVRRLSA